MLRGESARICYQRARGRLPDWGEVLGGRLPDGLWLSARDICARLFALVGGLYSSASFGQFRPVICSPRWLWGGQCLPGRCQTPFLQCPGRVLFRRNYHGNGSMNGRGSFGNVGTKAPNPSNGTIAQSRIIEFGAAKYKHTIVVKSRIKRSAIVNIVSIAGKRTLSLAKLYRYRWRCRTVLRCPVTGRRTQTSGDLRA